MRSISFSLFLLCMFFVMLTSCAGRLGAKKTSEALEAGHAFLARNAHVQALAFLAEAYNKYHDDDLLDLYQEAARRVKNAGDEAFKQKEFAKAGLLYHALQESAVSESDEGDREYLEKRVRDCSRMLTDQGLKEYREENLPGALALWEQVLQFDHQNDEVINAVATASRQRARVETMN